MLQELRKQDVAQPNLIQDAAAQALAASPPLPPIQVPTLVAAPTVSIANAPLPLAPSAAVAPLPASASVAIANAPLPAAILSGAMSMYTAGNVSRSFTKGHIKAILHSVFDFSISSNSKIREDMLKKLKEQEADQPSLFEDVAE